MDSVCCKQVPGEVDGRDSESRTTEAACPSVSISEGSSSSDTDPTDVDTSKNITGIEIEDACMVDVSHGVSANSRENSQQVPTASLPSDVIASERSLDDRSPAADVPSPGPQEDGHRDSRQDHADLPSTAKADDTALTQPSCLGTEDSMVSVSSLDDHPEVVGSTSDELQSPAVSESQCLSFAIELTNKIVSEVCCSIAVDYLVVGSENSSGKNSVPEPSVDLPEDDGGKPSVATSSEDDVAGVDRHQSQSEDAHLQDVVESSCDGKRDNDPKSDKSNSGALSKSTCQELKKEAELVDVTSDTVDRSPVDVIGNLCPRCDANDRTGNCADGTRLDEVSTPSETGNNLVSQPSGAQDINSSPDTKNEPGDAVADSAVSVVYGEETLTKTGCQSSGERASLASLRRGSSSDVVDAAEGVSREDPGCSPSSCHQRPSESEVIAGGSLIGERDPKTDANLGWLDRRRFSLRRLKRDGTRSSLIFKKSTELAVLVEQYLKDVYVPFDSVKVQLVRQSRDILLCRYQGDFALFRERFLNPAASLLICLRKKYPKAVCVCGKFSNHKPFEFGDRRLCCASCRGWPLCFNRRIVVHLGELDEGLVKPGDCYVFIKEDSGRSGTVNSVCLSFKHRPRSHPDAVDPVREHQIDEKDFGRLFSAMDWLANGDNDVMISDEQLTTVLQHLLLSVERGIERLEWDCVSKHWPAFSNQTGVGSRCCHAFGGTANTKDSSVQTSPEHEISAPPLSDRRLSIADADKDLTADLKLSHNGGYSLGTGSRKDQNEGPEDTLLRLPAMDQADDEADDGYYEHTLTHPTAISQVDQDVLHSQVALLPGSRDVSGRSVVILSSAAHKENAGSISPCHLAQLLLYFRTIPKKEVISQGFFVLIDGSSPSEEFWSILDETFCLLEANVANAVSQTVLLTELTAVDAATLFPTSRIQCEVFSTRDKLQKHIRKDQLLLVHGGSFAYDHQEWISFRKFLEPFVNGCRLSGRHLVKLLEDLRGSRLPPSSALTHQLIEQQKTNVRVTFQDEQLRHLEEEGDTILKELESYRRRSPHNADYCENLDRTTVLYEELRKAMTKLSRLADKRLRRLEECLQMRTFQEESSQVLSWLCRKGSDSLEKHQSVADSLLGIKEQEEEFEKFYFLAMRQIERGNDLLEEVSALGQESSSLPKIREESPAPEEEGGVQELAASLRQHLGSFSEKLEGTRERIEDTAKCYQLVDKSYEWALEAMRFVSQMGLANTVSVEGIVHQVRCLQEYLDDHLPISEDTFQEVMDIAVRLGSEKLLEQCKVAKSRCQETVDLIQARLATLLKVKQQMEVESFRGPLWDCEDSLQTPRTSRSHSQPSNLWATPVSSTPYPSCLGHHRRCSDTSAISSVPQSFGSPMGSYTSFPSSYYPTSKEPYQLDTYMQDKEDLLLQRGLITEDLTSQGPVASISKGFLDSRIGHKDSPSSASSSSSSSSSSGKGVVTSVLRSSGRGSYTVNSSGGVSLRWNKKSSKRTQSWQLRDETLEKIKNEVREQNALLRVERLRSSAESSSENVCSSAETDLSPSSDSCCKVPHSHAQTDPARGPVPVNTHLMTQNSSSDAADSGNSDSANNAEAKARKTLMLIMKEMIQTERDYVKSLEYIIENYIPELLREDIPQALRGQRNVVFGNIEKIYEFHSQFFLNELEQCENTPFYVGQCFLKYEPQFYLYALYNKNKPKSDALIIEYGNAFFRKKQLELADKMDLASYLLKPVQRMGKYALLLKQLLKECPEREPEHQDLKAAEEMVKFQLRHGNDLLAMDALRDCDVNVKEQGRLLRQDEFLVWQGRSRKSLRHVFLFEDLILFSKARRDPQRKGYEMYQYKHSIKTTDMGLTEQVGDSPTKFEIWFRKRKVNDTYVLQALSPDIKAAWVHELSKLLWKQALRNREMRLAEMSSMGIGNKPCLDIKPSEDQINDRSITLHQLARAPRFRNSIGMAPYDVKSNKRPHSIISVSSSSSSGSSQSSFTFYGTLNLGFEPGDSPRPLHRSLTQQSQCSTESGFCTDTSAAGDSPTDSEQSCHKKAERSDSLLSSDSLSTSASPSELTCLPSEEQNVVEESITTSM